MPPSNPLARVKAVHTPGDFPGTPDETTQQALAALFTHLFPNATHPEIDQAHVGIAIAARNPTLALNLAKLSAFIAGELPWCQRRDLRELAIQAVNVHFKAGYSFNTRAATAAACGISVEQQRALSSWRASTLFSDEQRFVIEYTHAVVTGSVPNELFSRVVAKFGEQGAVECTALISFWSFWAMFLNATGPQLRPDF